MKYLHLPASRKLHHVVYLNVTGVCGMLVV